MGNKRIRNICITLLFIILFIYLVIFVNSIMNGNKIGLLSYKFYIMSSESADLDIDSGDLIIAKSIEVKDIKENDSIIYNINNTIMVKKVTSVNKDNNSVNLYIQGDNAGSSESVQKAQIIGKVVHKIKGFGNVAMFIQSPLGTINILLICVCIFILVKKILKNTQEEDTKIIKDVDSMQLNDEKIDDIEGTSNEKINVDDIQEDHNKK